MIKISIALVIIVLAFMFYQPTPPGHVKSFNDNVAEVVDSYFQKWVKAWKDSDYRALRTFGHKDMMEVFNHRVIMNNFKNNILLYPKFQLYKVEPSTFKEIDYLTTIKGSAVEINAFFVAQKSDGEYNIATIIFWYDKSISSINLQSYRLYSEEAEPMQGLPPEYKPKDFASPEETHIQIDKIIEDIKLHYPKE